MTSWITLSGTLIPLYALILWFEEPKLRFPGYSLTKIMHFGLLYTAEDRFVSSYTYAVSLLQQVTVSSVTRYTHHRQSEYWRTDDIFLLTQLHNLPLTDTAHKLGSSLKLQGTIQPMSPDIELLLKDEATWSFDILKLESLTSKKLVVTINWLMSSRLSSPGLCTMGFFS